MGFLSNIFRGNKATKRITTVNNPFCIQNPIIGFLNLQGEQATQILEQDHQILAPLFQSSKISSEITPKCQVLFIYCSFDKDGQIIGSSMRIQQIIKDAGAYVTIIATENNPDLYIKAIDNCIDWKSNIVMVINRKTDKFSKFFQELFTAMFEGESMLITWVKLAPQIPGHDHPNTPETIMVAEAGHVIFNR